MSLDEPLVYKLESDLCAAFVPWASEQGWVAYAETAGWDIVLVHADGTQIGVQAKLRFNMKVLDQALPERWGYHSKIGPDFRAVLVPEMDGVADKIAGMLGLGLFWGDRWKRVRFAPSIGDVHSSADWHYWNPEHRLPLPSHVPDVAAGASGPSQLTEWKIKALKVAAVLEIRGWVTRQTFRELDLDHRRWTGPDGWLGSVAGHPGRWEWRKDRERPGFERQHPVVYPKVLEEMRPLLARGIWDLDLAS